MAPFFGSSTVIWANTIAVVLLALSVGYWLGGRLADRRPRAARAGRAGAARQRAAGGRAVHRAPVPVAERERVRRPVGRRVHGLAVRDARAGRRAAAAARRGVAVGDAAASWRRSRRRASVAGRLYAISTVGSLVGVFFVALWAIEAIGTQRTFLVLAAVPGARRGAAGSARASLLVPAALVAALALPVGTTKPADDGRVLYETETPYQYARVVEEADGTRKLELNEGQAIHSLWRPGHGADRRLLGRLPRAAVRDRARARPPARIAALGTAGGTVPRAYAHYFPDTRIDAVDIDPELFEIGRRYFGLEARPQLREFAEDARPFLRGDRRALRLDLRRRLPAAVHPVLPDDAGVLRARARPAAAGRLGDHQRRPPARLGRAREGAERHTGRGVRARRPRPDPVAELARDRVRRAAVRRGACARRRCPRDLRPLARAERRADRAGAARRRRSSPTTARRSSG